MRTKKIIYDSKNYDKSTMAGVIYGKNDQKIKKTKVITKTKPKKIKIKTVEYGPVNYYGKQKKTITKKVIKK